MKVINNVSFSIPVGSRVGIVGSSGCGKSTLVDLLMGLLSPSSGEIIDNKIISSSECTSPLIGEWRAMISHVPQSVFLFDSSILRILP